MGKFPFVILALVVLSLSFGAAGGGLAWWALALNAWNVTTASILLLMDDAR